MQTRPTGYYSSNEKDIIRQYFDLPLLYQFHERKDGPLSYFGLPGAEAFDIRTWRDVIGDVVAVERNARNLEQLEQLFDTQLPEVRYTTHWGELDKVILTNRGRGRNVGGEYYRRVGNSFENSIGRYVWRFDIVYLDYFGPFLPQATSEGSARARERATALRHLFALDRVDAWQPWILLVTVEAKLYDETMRSLLRDYLQDARNDASSETHEVLTFLLSTAPTSSEEAARLIHGSTAILMSVAASNANLGVQPERTVLYHGSANQPMVHMAFEFNPTYAPLGPDSQSPLPSTGSNPET